LLPQGTKGGRLMLTGLVVAGLFTVGPIGASTAKVDGSVNNCSYVRVNIVCVGEINTMPVTVKIRDVGSGNDLTALSNNLNDAFVSVADISDVNILSAASPPLSRPSPTPWSSPRRRRSRGPARLPWRRRQPRRSPARSPSPDPRLRPGGGLPVRPRRWRHARRARPPPATDAKPAFGLEPKTSSLQETPGLVAAAAMSLSERPGLRDLGRWVHMLGFRGHFVTKSRRYSTTLGELRATRAAYRARQDEPSGMPTRRARRSYSRCGSTSAPATSTPETSSWRPASSLPTART